MTDVKGLTSSTHPPPPWSPEDSPRLSQPWLVSPVSSCPSLSFHSPIRPQHRPNNLSLTPLQSHRGFSAVSCTHQKTSISSAGGNDRAPLLCVQSSSLLSWKPGFCTPPRSQCPNPGCSPVDTEGAVCPAGSLSSDYHIRQTLLKPQIL